MVGVADAVTLPLPLPVPLAGLDAALPEAEGALLLLGFCALSLSTTAFHPCTRALAWLAMSASEWVRSLPTTWPILVACGQRRRTVST